MRRAVLTFALLASITACQKELDDKPAADPLQDAWVDSIESEPADELAVAPAPAAAPVVVAAPSDPGSAGGEAPSAPAIEPGTTPDPATAEAAKLAGASTAAKPSSGGSSSPVVAPAGAPDGAAPDPAAAPSEEPAAAAPSDPAAAAIEPAPAPAAEPAQPAAPQPITMADFDGSYRYSGGTAQREALTQAIEDAANQLNVAIRGIGRKRLTNTNPIDNSLEIKVSGDKVQTIFETGFDAECTIDGGTEHWTSKKGDKYKVRVRQKDEKIVQIIEGEDGVKTTVFVLSADRKKLTVHHKITSDRLDEPMTYKLSYTRK